MARVRTFVAVEVGAAIRANAVALQKTLARSGANVKWVEPANLHVTLVFLGEVDDRDLHGVCQAVKSVAATESPFALRASGVGGFPTARRPKVAWAGLTDGSADLVRIHAKLEEALSAVGAYRKEERAYTPHLTLGRVTDEADGNLLSAELPKHLGWQGGHTGVDELIVFSSEMRRTGPEYAALARAPLTGHPATA